MDDRQGNHAYDKPPYANVYEPPLHHANIALSPLSEMSMRVIMLSATRSSMIGRETSADKNR